MIKLAILFRLFDYSLFHVINCMPPLSKAPILGHETLTVPILREDSCFAQTKHTREMRNRCTSLFPLSQSTTVSILNIWNGY